MPLPLTRPAACSLCGEGMAMFEMETNTKYVALPNKHRHAPLTRRWVPGSGRIPRTPVPAGTDGGEKGVELQPNSLGLQATLDDTVRVTRLVTRTESALQMLALSAEADALPIVTHEEQPPRPKDK